MIQKTLLTIDNGFKLQPLEYVNVEDVINYIKEYKNDLLFKNFKESRRISAFVLDRLKF
jgi:hypothetical protein